MSASTIETSVNTTDEQSATDATVRPLYSGSLQDLTAYLLASVCEGRDIPTEHPVNTLGYADQPLPDGVDSREIDMSIITGGPSREFPTMCEWGITFEAVDRDEDWEVVNRTPVARMSVTAVNPYVGDALDDMDARSGDSASLAESVFATDGMSGDLTEDLDELVGADYLGSSVAFVDTFTVEPQWRGTDLTPVLALRALNAFAHMGITVAVLQAAPIEAIRSGAHRRHAIAGIARMWARAGFERFYASNSNPEGNVLMATSMSRESIEEALDRLVVGHTGLTAARGED